MFTYPPKPWSDGQVHQVVTEDGHYITGVYDMSSNTWNLHHGTTGGHAGGLVMTPDVKTINTPPTKPIPSGTRISYPNINNQQDANWALQKQIDDIRGLTTSVWVGNSLEEPPLGQDGEVIYHLWYQTDNETLLQYSFQAQEWVPIKGEGAANIAFSSIPPEFPSPFNAWFNVLSKETFVAYNGQWWEISRNKDVTDLMFAAQQLNDEKVSKSGDTMSGDLKFSGTDTISVLNSETLRLKSSTNEQTTGFGTNTHITIGRDDDSSPTTNIYHLQYPEQSAWAANKEYVDDREQEIQNQIDDGLETQQEIISDVETLQNKVQALEGSVIDATWSFEEDSRTPRDGEFGLRSGSTATSVWTDADSILISTVSLDGANFTFEKVTVNDVIRIGAADSSNAEYKILSIAEPGAYLVEHLRSGGVPSDETEYAFTFLSAFDPAGLASIDYVDAQDALNVSKSGDTVQGPLVFDTNNSIVEVSGDTGSMRRRYLKVRGNNQFEIIAYPGQDNTGSKTVFKLEANTDDNPELTLNYLKDPTQAGNAVNKRWGDANYYPFTGGTITGNVIIDGGTLYMRDGDGNETARIQPNGFIRTYDLYRSQRDDGGPALQARVGTTLNAEIRCDGKATFKESVKKDGKELATEEYVDGAVSGFDTSNFVTISTSQSITGTKVFDSGKLTAGESHSSTVIGMNLKGRLQINGGSGAQGQVLVSRGSSNTVQWRNVVASSSSQAGNGGFYQASGSLYYVAY